MSFGATPSQPKAKKLFNIDALQTSGNQQDVLGTYFAGQARIALTWLTPIYNLTSKNVDSGSGKSGGKGGSGASQKNYYGDFAAFACVCPDNAPTDSLAYVLVDGNVAFTGPINRGGGYYSSLTLETYCQEVRWYYGKKDQPVDDLVLTTRGPYPDPDYPAIVPRDQTTWPTNQQIEQEMGPTTGGAGDPNPLSGHYDISPAYRNQCYFVFQQMLLGSSGVRPTIEVILGRGALIPGGGGTTYGNGLTGVPVIAPAYEIMTDDMFGVGKKDADIDITSWLATNSAQTAIGNYLAPFANQAGTFRSWFTDFVQYYDGWFRRKQGGTIEAGYWPHGYIDPTTLPQIASDDLTGEPEIKPGTDLDTKNDFRINYTNRQAWYNTDSSLRFVAQDNLFRVGKRRKQTLDRPFIIDGTIAQSHVVEYGTLFSELPSTGTVPVKRESAANFKQGDRFTLDIASNSVAIVLKVLSRDRDSDTAGDFKLTVENHRANWPTLYVQPPLPKDPDFEVYADAITQQLLRELPSGLKNSNVIELGVLCRRPTYDIIGFHLYTSVDNVTYDQIEDQGHFAAYGQVAVLYNAGTPQIDGTIGIQVDLYGSDLISVISQTASQRDDNNLLLFVGLEIMSVWTVTPVMGFPGRVKIFVKRDLYGTLQSDHGIGNDVWIIYRSQLTPVSSINFTPGSTQYFKLQGFTTGPVFDLAECIVVPHVFSGGAVAETSTPILTTSYVAASDGTFYSQIVATWTYALDQDISFFIANYKRSADSLWIPFPAGADGSAVITRLEPNVSYDVRVQAISSDGEPSAFSTIASITTAGPNFPAAPTGLTIVPGVQSIGVKWINATSQGIVATQVFKGPTSTFAFATLQVTVPLPASTWIDAGLSVSAGWFYWLKSVNSLGIASTTPAGPQFGVPIVPAATQCATPGIFQSPVLGTGTTAGDNDYRVVIVDEQGALGPGAIYFSINNGAFNLYSKTGNYQGTTGSTLPTDNNGAISLAQYDYLQAYTIQTGYLQSAAASFFNNSTKTPNRGGGGGGSHGPPGPPLHPA